MSLETGTDTTAADFLALLEQNNYDVLNNQEISNKLSESSGTVLMSENGSLETKVLGALAKEMPEPEQVAKTQRHKISAQTYRKKTTYYEYRAGRFT